jgi:ribosomal protein S6--L-glutamate ligase
MGNQIKSYFRIGGESFYNNVSKGAKIDYDLLPEKQKQGVDLALVLAKKARIDIAAFDIMFPEGGGPPVVIEINFLFGRKGLGGLKGYEGMYRQAIDGWIAGVLEGKN